VPVGQYVCDLLVDNKVIVEVKAVKSLLPEHEAQILNYLKATGIEIGLLLNFGREPEIRRRVYTKDRKFSPLINAEKAD
jgi:GxxExxY protein